MAASGEIAHIALPARVARGELESIRSSLVEALASGKDIVLDLTSVLAVDGPGVQLILACCKSAAGGGKQVRFSGTSKAFWESMAKHHATECLQS
ncbi:MAG: STAS domain-containing protein [Bdellovibrionota bacterium]